MTVTYCGA